MRSLPKAGGLIAKGSDEPTFRIGETLAGHSLDRLGHGLRRAAEEEKLRAKWAGQLAKWANQVVAAPGWRAS